MNPVASRLAMSINEQHDEGSRSRRVSDLRESAEVRQRPQQNGAPGDDLFLSLALNDADAPQRKPLGRLGVRERTRSNESINASSFGAHSPGLPQTGTNSPSLTQTSDGSIKRTRQDDASSLRRTPRYTIGTTTLSHFERAAREWNATPDLLKPSSRRQSPAISRQARAYRQGGYKPPPRANTTPTLSPFLPVQKKSDPETDSVESNNAPSTVWDELDDLKSRIKKLEITPKVPSTSNAAVANASQSFERPRTATTAPTTISSSPVHARKQSNAPTDMPMADPATASLHPLLHSALAKAKTLLNPQLYRSLEATAEDALALAAMTGSGGPQGTAFTAASIINGVAVSERHIRRKADSMCRNLTDLCIALCDGKSLIASPTIKASPMNISRLQGETPPSRYARRTSLGPDDLQIRTSPGRTSGNRRSSLLGLGVANPVSTSPGEPSDHYLPQDLSPSHDQTDYAARYSRPGTSLRRGYPRYDEDMSDDLSIRAPSRAMTDVGHMRQQSSRRTDYGIGLQQSPSWRDALSARRSTVGIPEETSQDESTPSPLAAHHGARRFLERHSTPQNEERLFVPEKRRRIASLSQYSTSNPRSVNEPMRTTSLSRRRNIVVE